MDFNVLYDIIKSYRDKGIILPSFPFIIYYGDVYECGYDSFNYDSF